jgi:ribonuclease D
VLTTTEELARLADDVRAAGRLAIDTEFVWERTYRPMLGVVQVAAGDRVEVIDALAVKDLSPLFPVLTDPAVTTVLHGGGQDLEIFASLMGEPVRGVADTQVIAAFLGYGLQAGLLALLERVLKVRLKKDQTYTDWTRRPLKPEQVVYAREDVTHLLALYDRLQADVEKRGRTAWVAEELRALEETARFTGVPDDERYQAVKGWQRLSARELAVLRELAAWRERAARRADIRPNFVANDIVLVTLAARPVDTVEDLRQVRGLSSGSVDRHAKAILTALRAGRECPQERWPEHPGRLRRKPPPPGLTALLRAAVQIVAEREDVAPEVIASTRDIETLAASGANNAGAPPADVPLTHGWRQVLVGDTLLAIVRGEVAMRYDPARRTVVGEPLPAKG